MTITLKKLLCVLLLCVPAAFCQRAGADGSLGMFSEGMTNGRGWLGFTSEQRTAFVLAVIDAVYDFRMLADSSEPGIENQKAHQQIADLFQTPNFSIGELAKEITKLYDDPANVRIPVVCIETTAVFILKGETSQQTESRLVAMRKAWNQ